MQPRINDKVGYNLIHTFICNKLSDRAKGKLHYQLWQHNDDQSFGVALSKNESSGGFSAELIKVEDIIELLGKLYRDGKPFHATALKELFIGKSVNNPSFLAAILFDQQLLRLHPNVARLLEVEEDFELWPIGLESHLKSEANTESLTVEATTTTTSQKKRQNKTADKVPMENVIEDDGHEIHPE
ncbi:hypothetical protein [Acinetobacter brisouii]